MQFSSYLFKLTVSTIELRRTITETKQPISKITRVFLTIISIALFTAVGSEIKVMPFDNAPFRFGLGSIIFFLALLIQPVPIITTGFITGITVVAFRTIVAGMTSNVGLWQLFVEHFPAALFYILFAICLRTINLRQIKSQPFLLGLYGIAFETLANSIEQLAIMLFVTKQWASPDEFLLFLAVAFLRSFFVVGLYSAITVAEQKKQLQQLLNIHAELYVETLYLQKSMEQIEKITADSFQLYKELKPIDPQLSAETLRISQEIHEIKKDSQRIYAGLAKIVTTEQTDTFLLSDVLHIVTEANEKYAQLLDKHITFATVCQTDMRTHEHIALLAILNNLVANAVEAIEKAGAISITVTMTGENATFTVEDNGSGIKNYLLPIIFDAGFTSKFNPDGIASTGIGLSHVETIVTRLNGQITVESEDLTTFVITIPTTYLRFKEVY